MDGFYLLNYFKCIGFILMDLDLNYTNVLLVIFVGCAAEWLGASFFFLSIGSGCNF